MLPNNQIQSLNEGCVYDFAYTCLGQNMLNHSHTTIHQLMTDSYHATIDTLFHHLSIMQYW